MKKRALSLALAALLALSTGVCAMAAGASSNRGAENYNTHAKPVTSYLFPTEDGGVTRVEYGASGSRSVLVEEYDANLVLRDTKTISLELPLWGGFYAGERYNFLVSGQINPWELDTVEVMRVVKYSKDWIKLGQASLRGVNTSEPFNYGSLRMAEGGGMLYIRTSHQMYTDKDGNKPQSNMTVAIRESDMAVTDSAHLVEDVGCGYMSHSFNQFILVDSSRRIVALDHCDSFPFRGVVLSIFPVSAGSTTVTDGSVTNIPVQSFPVVLSDDLSVTGASVGGFGDAGDAYVAAYNYDGQGVSTASTDKSVYLAAVDKKTGSFRSVCLSLPGTSTPQLVTDPKGGGMVLWNETDAAGNITDTLHYASFDKKGVPSDMHTSTAPLSDCAPILTDGRVLWYVTEGGVPTFYELTDRGVRALRTGTDFTDVPEGSLLYSEVMWSAMTGCVDPVSDTVFGAEREATRAQVVYGLWRAFGSPAVDSARSPFTDVSKSSPYYSAILWAVDNEITNGTTSGTFSPDGPVTRAETVTFLYRAAKAQVPRGAANPFRDVPKNQYYTDPVLWAVDKGITNGTSDDTFSPDRVVTRRELAAFLSRWNAL